MTASPATSGGRAQVARLDLPITPSFEHRLVWLSEPFGAGFDGWAGVVGLSGGTRRALAVIDDGVAQAWGGLGARIASSCARAGVVTHCLTVAGGESIKNDWGHVEAIIDAIETSGICRKSHVLAIGGGAVLDAAGLAASLSHRGVRLVRFPTTTLAQADSAIGVKTGVNRRGVKNAVGTFSVPEAVVIDEGFLATLDDRDWRAGFSEAVKVALLRSEPALARIEAASAAVRARDINGSRGVLRESAELHARHVADGGDPFEQGAARPLDFGHWAAHRIESLSGFAVRHGEAVSVGLAIDLRYAALVGLLDASDAERGVGCLSSLGLPTSHGTLDDPEGVLEGLEQFRAHLGGDLALTLATGIGRSVEVGEVDRAAMVEAMGRCRRGGRS